MTRSLDKLSIFEAKRTVPRIKTLPGTMWRPWWQRDRRGHKKTRFREKLETKKCRDTQYRHIIVTIVTLPVGLSACDLLLLIGQLSAFSPSDWLMVLRSSSLVFVTLVTVFQVISHSVTAHQMSWEPWVLCGGPECVTLLVVIREGHEETFEGSAESWLMAPSEDNYPQIVFTRSSSQHNRL